MAGTAVTEYYERMSLALFTTGRETFLPIPLLSALLLGIWGFSLSPAQAQSLTPVDTARRFFCDAQTHRVYRSKNETKYKKITRKKARALIKTFRKRRKTTASSALRHRLQIRIRGMRDCLRGDIPSACSVVSSKLVSSSNRIVNGYVCDEDSSPVVLLLLNTDEEPNFGVCSGSIIQNSPLIILTAAHCLFPSSANITSVTVVIGGESFSTTTLTPHPEYTPSMISAYADLAILEFDATTTIPPLRGFSEADEMKSPIRHVAAGYGNTTPGLPASGLDGALRATDIRVIESSGSAVVSDTTSKTGGICTGDSGGPLLVGLESGEWRIVGVSSYLISPSTNSPLCAADNINVYASTTFTEHLTFIRQFAPDFGS